jgi:hypothetical protein
MDVALERVRFHQSFSHLLYGPGVATEMIHSFDSTVSNYARCYWEATSDELALNAQLLAHP